MAALGMGLTGEELYGRLEEIVALKLPAVQAQAKALSSLEDAVVVIAGDPASILAQLEEIGILDAEVLSRICTGTSPCAFSSSLVVGIGST